MSENAIDPDAVIAMSAATLISADDLTAAGSALQGVMDSVSDLAPGEPRISGRLTAIAGNLAESAGWAKSIAVHFVDHEKPIGELLKVGFWVPHPDRLAWDPSKTVSQNAQSILTSDEFGAVPLGVASELLSRFRLLSVPTPTSAIPVIARVQLPVPENVFQGEEFVVGSKGIWVPAGSAADPATRLPATIETPGWANKPLLSGDPGMGVPPSWARMGGKALFVAGAGLTLWGSYADQYNSDARYHPDWSSGQRIASATTNTVVVGGSSVVGAYVGATYGAEAGAAIGTMICPGLGTVAGGIIGGVAGAFVGSEAGKAVGTGLKEVGSAAVDEGKKIWHSVFG